MHDGITFEQLGKRAIVLCTVPFEVTAKNIASVLGLPEFPFVLLEHPLGSKTMAQVDQMADVAATAAEQILTT